MKKIQSFIERVAPTNLTVRAEGESGTGKGITAKGIHFNSPRQDKPFVAVNCASIPEGLFESEMFGHEKGAFTDAKSKKLGKFELAHGGTLFLDQVPDIPLRLQPKLLNALEDEQIWRVGGTKPIPIDVRIIAASKDPLLDLVEAGDFREDLYYRLNQAKLSLLPLRESPEDILVLIRFYVTLFSLQENVRKVRSISKECEQAAVRYPWPGNARELKAAIRRAIVLGTGPELLKDDIPCQPVARSTEQSELLLYRRFSPNAVTERVQAIKKLLVDPSTRSALGTKELADYLKISKRQALRVLNLLKAEKPA